MAVPSRQRSASFNHRRNRLRFEPLEDRRMLSVLFVDDDAASGGDGLAWETAFDDLQPALESASASGEVDQIWIAEGTYLPSAELEPGDARSASFRLLDGVALYGGFAGTETLLDQRDWTAHETVLSGDLGVVDDPADNAYTVVYCDAGIESRVDGVTITDGNADGGAVPGHDERRYGGGIYTSGTLTVANSTITENVVTENIAKGGGIYNNAGTLTVESSAITENRAIGESTSGGGIFNVNGILTVHNSTLAKNRASSHGGGIFSAGSLILTNSTLTGNTAGYGGGIKSFGAVTITNSTLAGNTADSNGGGIHTDSLFGALTVTNSILVGNTAGSEGGGIHDVYGNVAVVNSTLTGNAADKGGGIFVPGHVTLANSIVALNTGDDIMSTLSEESGNNLIGVDPRFARNPGTNGPDDYGDLRLTAISAAIDAGDSSRLPADTYDLDGDGNTNEPLPLDMDGNARVFGKTVDMGAYEYQAPSADGRETPSTVVTTTADTFDLYDNAVSLREAIHYAKLPSLDPVVSFAPALSGSTILLDGTSLYVDKGMRIDASSLAEGLTIDGDGRSRIFTIASPQDDLVKLVDLTITNGQAGDGGGVCIDKGTVAITNSTFLGNSADQGGGVFSAGPLTVANSLFAGNTAVAGGGIYDLCGTLTVVNSTLAGNAAVSAGGIFGDASITLFNSIVTLNGADEIVGAVSPDSANNLIGVDPKFVRNPGTNGADDYGDLRLMAESAAIDAGDSDRLPADALDLDGDGNTDEPLPVDLEGNPRVFGESVDIGAYEYQAAMAGGRETPSTMVTTAADTFDLYDGEISLREAIFYTDFASLTPSVTFAPELSDTKILLDGTSLCVDTRVSIDASSLAGGLTIDANGKSRVFTILAADGQSVELVGLTITGGQAERGGGIYNFTAVLSVANSTITGNTASLGGAISTWHGPLVVLNSTIIENTASSGGGLYNRYNKLIVLNSTIAGNTASSGGGLYNWSGMFTATNTTLVGNTALDQGGGMYDYYGLFTVTNCTVAGNAAGSAGGGLYTYASPSATTVQNTIVVGNTALSGPDVCDDSVDVSGFLTLTGTHNIIGNGADQSNFVDGQNGNLVGTPESPIDALFIRNPSDGGDGWGDDPSTPDVDESANDDYGELRLRPDSPAVDAGNIALLPADVFDLDDDGNTPEPIPVDLAGNARIEDGNGDGTAIIDMGAYELITGLPGLPGDLNGDAIVNSEDLDIVRANWGASVSVGDLLLGDPSGDGVVNSDDLNIVRANWGQTAPPAVAAASVQDLGDATDDPFARQHPAAAGYQVQPSATHGRDAYFAQFCRALAETAWAERVAGPRERHALGKPAAAVDSALLGWE